MSEHTKEPGSGTAGSAKSAQVDGSGRGKEGSVRAEATDPVQGSATLHAPWRLEYLERISKEAKDKTDPGTGCFLRDLWLTPQRDVENHVVVRTKDGMILLNRFPYSNGHLLVALGDGKGRLNDYTPKERAALWRLTDAAADMVEEALEPQGINIGVNQGKASGAGVPQHLHVHLVPRWAGDVNFMTVVASVRVIPSSLEIMAERYRSTWSRIRGRWEGQIGS